MKLQLKILAILLALTIIMGIGGAAMSAVADASETMNDLSPEYLSMGITASSTYNITSGYDALKAVDGNKSTRWNSLTNSVNGEYLIVKFDVKQIIDSVKIFESPDISLQRTRKFTIEYWDYETEEWKALATGERIGSAGVNKTFAAVSADIIRLHLNSTEGLSATISEFEIYSGATKLIIPPNVEIQGAGYYASSFFDDNYNAAKAFDGDKSTRWNAYHTSQPPHSLEISFGSKRTVDKVVIFEHLSRITEYKIQYWGDGEWRNCAEGTTIGESASGKAHSFAPVETSRVRLYITKTNDFNPTVWEMEVYNGTEKLKTDKIGEIPENNTLLSEFAIPNGTVTFIGNEILVRFPSDTNLTALVPTYKISSKSTCSPASGSFVDFTNPVTYKVTAQSGYSVDYLVQAIEGNNYPQDDKDKAKFVSDMIAAIPETIYLNNETQIYAVQLSFENLTLLQKSLIIQSEKDKLSAAYTRITDLKNNNRIKITCVGDSITEGTGATSGKSYPAQMQEILGDEYYVHNAGASGSCMIRDPGFYACSSTAQYAAGLALNPDIVIIMLGCNDGNEINWPKNGDTTKAMYKNNYKIMIDEFKSLPSKPVIYLTYPTSSYGSVADGHCINDFQPVIDELSEEYGLEIIDMYKFTVNHMEWMPDRVHPDDNGYYHIAKEFAKYVEKVNSIDLEDFKINGTSYLDFKPDKYVYTYEYSDKIPSIDAIPVSKTAKISIIQATETDKTAYITIKSLKESHQNVYKVNFVLPAVAQTVIDLINTLGDITSLKQKEAVEAGRAAYDALTEVQQKLVTNYSALQTAEDAIRDIEAAVTVNAEIEALGIIASLDQKPSVEAARSAYNKLTETQKSFVTELSALEAAEAKIEELAGGILGDVDDDNTINVSDVIKLRQLIINGSCTEKQRKSGDFDEDGNLTVSDVVALRSYIIKGASVKTFGFSK